MHTRRKAAHSLVENVFDLFRDLLYPEEVNQKESNKKSEYYQNPFGGFLP